MPQSLHYQDVTLLDAPRPLVKLAGSFFQLRQIGAAKLRRPASFLKVLFDISQSFEVGPLAEHPRFVDGAFGQVHSANYPRGKLVPQFLAGAVER